MQKNGFSVLELTIAMAIAAILMAAGVPAFQNYGWNLRLKTAMDTLQTDLHLARSRAITHNVQTVVCPALVATDCSGSAAWRDGWIVFADMNGDHRRQAVEPLLKTAVGVENLDITGSRSRNYLRFYPNGSAPGSNISLVFCDRRGASYAGKLMISNTGRVRSETGGIEPTTSCL